MEPSYSNYRFYSAYNQENYHPNPRNQPSERSKYLDKYLEDYALDDDQLQVDNQIDSMYERDQYQDFTEQSNKEQSHEYDEVKVLCTYCNQSYPLHSFQDHEAQCDMKKITCERCGKKVLIEVFDMHEVECSPRTNQRGNQRQATYNIINHREEPGRNRAPFTTGLTNNLRNTRNQTNHQNQRNPVITIGPRRNHANRLPVYNQDIHIAQYDYMNHLQQQPDVDVPESATYEDLLALDNNIVKKGLTKTQLEKFKTRTFVTSTESTQACSVCMSDYELGERLRKIKCGHEFHMSCIDTWLKENITCPVCKKELR